MIAFTYITSGILLALTGWLFTRDLIERRSDRLLDDHLLFCVGGREFSLPYGERNIST